MIEPLPQPRPDHGGAPRRTNAVRAARVRRPASLARDQMSMWLYLAELDSWIWHPPAVTYEGSLQTVNRLTASGFEQLRHDDTPQLTALLGQLADVVTLAWPGSDSRRDHWALRADIERANAAPVALAFTVPVDAPLPQPEADGTRVLPMAVYPPPPQVGERALVLQGDRWTTQPLSWTGADGLALWQQLSAALRELNAPADWWIASHELEHSADRVEYVRMRQDRLSRLLTAHGAEREAIREQLAGLARLRRNAGKLQAARARMQQDRDAWLARWREVRNLAQELARLYWLAHRDAFAVQSVAGQDTAREAESAEVATAAARAPVAIEVSPVPGKPASALAHRKHLVAELLESDGATSLDTLNHEEDRAVREASLAHRSAWQTEMDIPLYKASNSLAVYFLDREHPLSLAEAQEQLLRVRESTVLTIRIAQGLWNLRRRSAALARNGSTLIAYDNILQWRGIAKHTKAAQPGMNTAERYTDGWRPEDREAVRRDFELAARYHLRGKHTVYLKGRPNLLNVDGPYVFVSFLSVPTLSGTNEPAGVWFRPGDWINTYADAGNIYLAEIDRRVFQLNPQNEQHELKIALYLTEEWRCQARDARYAEPITMAELLRRSVIRVDWNMLTARFAPRIEQALEHLRASGIIGAYACLAPVDKTRPQWGKHWLAARWRILPPDALRQSYIAKSITKDVRQLPRGTHAARSPHPGRMRMPPRSDEDATPAG